jgi:type VI protein secretion system component VasK
MCESNEADSGVSSFASVILFRIVILSKAKDLAPDDKARWSLLCNVLGLAPTLALAVALVGAPLLSWFLNRDSGQWCTRSFLGKP